MYVYILLFTTTSWKIGSCVLFLPSFLLLRRLCCNLPDQQSHGTKVDSYEFNNFSPDACRAFFFLLASWPRVIKLQFVKQTFSRSPLLPQASSPSSFFSQPLWLQHENYTRSANYSANRLPRKLVRTLAHLLPLTCLSTCMRTTLRMPFIELACLKIWRI